MLVPDERGSYSSCGEKPPEEQLSGSLAKKVDGELSVHADQYI